MKSILLILATVTAAVANMNPSNILQCSVQSCVIAYLKMDDQAFDDVIPEEIGGIVAVKFSSCQMEKIPSKVFERFPSMLSLMATSPGLRFIEPDSFISASKLQFLYLPGNHIKKLNANSFLGASNLTEINLNDNKIRFIDEQAFNGLEHLESISLSRNKISFLVVNTFKPLKSLTNLDLSGNKIEFLDARVILSNKNLNAINLAENKVVAITNQFLQLFPQIKVLNMANNPCTADTTLEKYPTIKTYSYDIEKENALKNCYQNYNSMYFRPAMNSAMGDLLGQIEPFGEEVEENLYESLNRDLRYKDKEIENLEFELLVYVILVGATYALFFTYYFIKFVVWVVDSTYQKKIDNVLKDAKIEFVKTEPLQTVYTISN